MLRLQPATCFRPFANGRISFAILIPLFLLCFNMLSAQNSLWQDIPEDQIVANQADRWITPKHYRTLHLDFQKLKDILSRAPSADDVAAGVQPLELSFPWPDGGSMRYKVWYDPIMHPSLAAQYPEIRTYSGQSLDIPGATIWFDQTLLGFHAMTLSNGQGTAYIEPYVKGNLGDYICFFKKDFAKPNSVPFTCMVEDNLPTPIPALVGDRAGDCGKLRNYRLALACTGEYFQFFNSANSNKAPVLAAMVTSMNRVNGVYQTEVSVKMNIVANDTLVIYSNPSTDPYTNNNGSTMLTQNQTTCDAQIGSGNYDIGHVFSTGGGGIAQLNSPCASGSKAKGVTGSPSPVGDDFDIDYVAHEMGHQFGGHHTFDGTSGSCSGNATASTAYEPGSGSTIMAYAGICPGQDIQPHSDAYFHAISLQEIGVFVTGTGNACCTQTTNTNSAPTASALTRYNIPKSTPFILTGSASDPNGDALTYCWEEWDNYTGSAPTSPPTSTATKGPVFRSFYATSNNYRYFPNLNDIVNNVSPTWEVLPSITRTLNFRMSVRDNIPAGGCTTEKNNTVTTNSTSGPFQVTSPNTAVSWPAYSSQTVTWNVASTTAAPVSCANVDILLSTDGGFTYSPLVSGVANSGSQAVNMPGTQTTTARIMVKGAGNIFFDISNANFTISAPVPIELTEFQAKAEAARVRLEWTTASEKNSKGFQIERSTDGTNYARIGWETAQGISTEMHQYSFVDQDVSAGITYYYRLREIDFDGQEQLSNVRVVTMAGESAEVRFSPNPAVSAAHLLLSNAPGDVPRQITA